MIQINSTIGDFVLDLNKYPYDIHELNIISKGKNDIPIPWAVEVVNSRNISAEKLGNKLFIKLSHKDLDKKAAIAIKNYEKERAVIEIIPNSYALVPKDYLFEITDKSLDNGILTINLLSTVNGDDQPWRCSYLGYPLSYELSKSEGDGSSIIKIRLLTELLTEFKSKLIFEQEKSGNAIELILYNDKDGIKKAD